MQNKKQNLYLALCVFILLLSVGMIALGAFFIRNQYSLGKDFIIYIVLLAVLLLLVISMLTLVELIAAVKFKHYLPVPKIIAAIADKVMFAMTVVLGRLVGVSKEEVLKAYISSHNQITLAQKTRVPGSKLLILLPHCLQNSDCPHKITIKVDNCKRCGKCDITEILELAERYRAQVRVATGGTLARKYIKEIKPQAVVAVACERDLSLGIRDISGNIPVLGVLNSCPQGPCINTTVDLIKMEQAIRSLDKGENE